MQRTLHTNAGSFLDSRYLSGKLLYPGFFSSSSSSLKKSSISPLDSSCVRKKRALAIGACLCAWDSSVDFS